MKLVFADTFYWTALINPRDTWHTAAQVVNHTLAQTQLVTTEEILIEVLNFFSNFHPYMRQIVSQQTQDILQNQTVQVIPQSHESFLAGLALYSQRLDKGYSLTDCISMNTMQRLEITEILTHDKHFAQEGFVILFPD